MRYKLSLKSILITERFLYKGRCHKHPLGGIEQFQLLLSEILVSLGVEWEISFLHGRCSFFPKRTFSGGGAWKISRKFIFQDDQAVFER